MNKHHIEQFQGKRHVAIKQLGNIIFAARVQPSGFWVMAQSIWQSDRRRQPAVEFHSEHMHGI